MYFFTSYGLKGQFLCWSLLAPLRQLHSGLDGTEWSHSGVWGLGCHGWNVCKIWASLSTSSHILDFSAWWSRTKTQRGPKWELLGLLRLAWKSYITLFVLWAKANQSFCSHSRVGGGAGEIGSICWWEEKQRICGHFKPPCEVKTVAPPKH